MRRFVIGRGLLQIGSADDNAVRQAARTSCDARWAKNWDEAH